MRKLLLAMVAVVVAVVVSSCGADPCDQLEEFCASCTDSTQKSTCNLGLEFAKTPLIGGGDDACQSLLDDSDFDSCTAP